ncbi:MAG TPA: YcaO-like family protein [Polyangiaceae bacterium]|nr:YcaO-like family protein [Polyangiaceae bacterium]
MLDGHRGSDSLVRALREEGGELAGESSARGFRGFVERAARLAGVTRVAEISFLSPGGVRVFQATRPDPCSHVFFGQNSSSQGKGRTRARARLSALLEAIEGYSAEPRNVDLVRGSYTFLQRVRPIISPDRYRHQRARNAWDDAPLVWTSALCLRRHVDVLVPAERVFFPFFPADYETKSFCLSSSTGLGAGVDLLQATLHGLHEVIERDYRAKVQRGSDQVVVEQLSPIDVARLPLVKRILRQQPELSVLVLSLRHQGASLDSPVMLMSILLDPEGGTNCGFCSDFSVRRALDRSLTEAMQCLVTGLSATREDATIRRLADADAPAPRDVAVHPAPALDSAPRVGLSELGERGQKGLDDPRREVAALVAFVASLGLPDVLVKDLTRLGIDVPVVRVVVPGAEEPDSEQRENYDFGWADLVTCRFSTDANPEGRSACC